MVFKVDIDQKEMNKKILRLRNLPDEMYPNVIDEIIKGANLIRNEAVLSIQRGRKSGRTYEWRPIVDGEEPDFFIRSRLGHVFPVKIRNQLHRASAPGEAPATDTGELVASLVVDARFDEIEVGAEVGAPYAEFLEIGTRVMRPRPFLEPALEKHSDKIEKDILDAIVKTAGDAFK